MKQVRDTARASVVESCREGGREARFPPASRLRSPMRSSGAPSRRVADEPALLPTVLGLGKVPTRIGATLVGVALMGLAGAGLAQSGGSSAQGSQDVLQFGSPPPLPGDPKPASDAPASGQPEVLQFGSPPPVPTDSGSTTTSGSTAQPESMQFGQPPPVQGSGTAQGDVLQFGTPPAATEPPPPAADGQPGVLQFGAPTTPVPSGGQPTTAEVAMAEEPSDLEIGLERLWLEAGILPDGGTDASTSNYLHGSAFARWTPDLNWEVRAGARVDGYWQTGTPSADRLRLDYGESFVRYRTETWRATVGAQTVLWARVDEIPPSDRLSVQDISRFFVDRYEDRRRAVPAARFELNRESLKADLVVVPWFRAAELPEQDSVWFPVNRRDGEIIGIELPAALSTVVARGTFDDDASGSGGVGFRLSAAGRGIDYAVTAQRARHSLPYYQLDPAVRAAFLGGASLDAALAAAPGATFVGRHPYTTVVGGDVSAVVGGFTLRFEGTWLSDIPATTTDFRMITTEGIDWVAGVEFYPGDADARVNLQVAGRHLLDPPRILDRDDVLVFNGEIESPLADRRLRGRLRFNVGLDEFDLYVNPEIAYVAKEPHELVLGLHYFAGAAGTPGGFHRNHSMISIGFKTRF